MKGGQCGSVIKRLSIPAALAAIDLELMISHHVGSPQKAVCMQGAHIVMLKKKEKRKKRALFEAYLLMRKTQLMLEYCLSVCQNLNLIRKRVESVRYGLSKMKICHSGWLKFCETWPRKEERKQKWKRKNREKKKRLRRQGRSFNWLKRGALWPIAGCGAAKARDELVGMIRQQGLYLSMMYAHVLHTCFLNNTTQS